MKGIRRLRAVLFLMAVNIGMGIGPTAAQPPAAFNQRLDAGTRQKLLLAHGGTVQSEAAVERGLRWLALHQANDGAWSLTEYNKTTREKPLGEPGQVTGFPSDDKVAGARESKVAATAYALLAFLGHGHTHKANKNDRADKVNYSATVQGGLNYLLASQRKDGSFGTEVYANAAATLALGEAYGMTGDDRLKAPAQAAVHYFVQGQHDEGGWRYAPKLAGDLSVSAWVVQALLANQSAGIAVPQATWTRFDRFLDSVYDEKNSGFCYTPGGQATPSMTAAGVYCKLQRGGSPRNPGVMKCLDRMMTFPARNVPKGFYTSYYTTQAFFHAGGDGWEKWNLGPNGNGKDGFREVLFNLQDTGAAKAHLDGSWPPTQNFQDGGSRILATAWAVLMLESYYRYPPRVQRQPE